MFQEKIKVIQKYSEEELKTLEETLIASSGGSGGGGSICTCS